ncbi:uncharacterized protein J4E79_007379 [Alternaria viburni]|uniref:uncharacterized protein n=1 Tax=Alternaria viburni TaxID=566460 RepID=UPI0020C42DD1|nr:uncharacterized protein J4E79_007379 [Alternaria viburni]KAI4657307.1 hypothetical protein J4E79_007379 [Alternaria viburni]
MAARLAALSDEQKENLKATSARSRFCDHQSPGTIARRKQARSNYCQYCQTIYEIDDEKTMYRSETLIGALQFWIDTYTHNFRSIETDYHSRVSGHIHMVAVEQGILTRSRERNELGELELGLMYARVMTLQDSVLQTKQHYIAWVVAYITAARPGSITVSKGYQQGAPRGGAMSDSIPTRTEAHTLQWSDVKFERFEQNYSCLVTFRFNKGHQDPHRQSSRDGSREFFSAPKQERLQLDIGALLFAEAYTRGLFVHPLDDLLTNAAIRFPVTRGEVARQAVFVVANTKGQLIPDQEMRQVALNKHLQDFSLAVGILCYFSMYSFRRQAAQEAKSEYSSEDAMALLGHRASNPDTLRHYDKHGFDRRDMTSFRLGGVQLEDASIRKFFSPSNRLWTKDASSGVPGRSLKQEVHARVRQMIILDPEYKKFEADLHGILSQIHHKLQECNLILPEEVYSIESRNIGKCEKMMGGGKLDERIVQRKFARVAVTQRTKEALRKSIESTSAERGRMGQYVNEMDIKGAEDNEYVEIVIELVGWQCTDQSVQAAHLRKAPNRSADYIKTKTCKVGDLISTSIVEKFICVTKHNTKTIATMLVDRMSKLNVIRSVGFPRYVHRAMPDSSRHPAASLPTLPMELLLWFIDDNGVSSCDILSLRLTCKEVKLKCRNRFYDTIEKSTVFLQLDAGFPARALALAKYQEWSNNITSVYL